jgi:hypothetical protein
MTASLNAAKKRVVRKHILQIARELYLHPQTGRAIASNLKTRFPALSLEHVHELFNYLAGKELVLLRENRSALSVQITPKGIDLLDGAITVRGVEPSSAQFTRLEYKKEVRRKILAYCNSFQEYFNEDTELLDEFRESGFSNLLIEEIRFHLWYLNQKSMLDLKTFAVGGEQVFMARITPRGIDVIECNETDPGVSDGC